MPGAKATSRTRSFKKRGGFDEYKERIHAAARASGPKIKYGILSDSGAYPDSNTPVLTVAIVHEFGYAPFNIPERSFLRSVPIENARLLKRLTAFLAGRILHGDIDLNTALGQLGIFCEGLTREKIIEGPFQALKRPRADGSTRPLNDTGLLRQSIRWDRAE